MTFSGSGEPGRDFPITSHRGAELTVTPADVIWLSRAVAREGAPRSLVAQALINRWAWLHDVGSGQRYPTLTSLIRAYSVPVNPRWFPAGDLHKDRVARLLAAGNAPGAESEALRAAQRRDEFSRATVFSDDVAAAVRDALMGPLTLPAGAVHYDTANVHGFPVIVAPRPKRNGFFGAPHDRSMGVLYRIGDQPFKPVMATMLDHAKPGTGIVFAVLATGVLYSLARGYKK